MVKAAKFMVLVGGIVGVVAFFLPMFSVEGDVGGQNKKVTVSAFQAVRGAEAVKASIESQAGVQVASADQKSFDDLEDATTKFKGVFLGMYAPAALLLLLGLIGVLKKKFGRVFGVLSVLFGLVAIALWGLIFTGTKDTETGQAAFALGLGIHLMLVSGILGFLGGIINTVKPDRGFM
jgi:hypothetical protein